MIMIIFYYYCYLSMHLPFSSSFFRITKSLSRPSTYNPSLFWRHVVLGWIQTLVILGGEEIRVEGDLKECFYFHKIEKDCELYCFGFIEKPIGPGIALC